VLGTVVEFPFALFVSYPELWVIRVTMADFLVCGMLKISFNSRQSFRMEWSLRRACKHADDLVG